MTLTLIWMIGLAQQRTDSVHIARYDLNISVMDFSGQTIDGHTDLTMVSKVNNLNELRLDLMSLTADSVLVDGQPATFTHVGEDLRIHIPALQSGDTALVRVYYHGTPTHDGGFGGVYFINGYAYSIGVALEDRPHAYGRSWFPCMDEFSDKSAYSFHIRTPNGKRAVCNGILTDSTDLDDDSRLWSWNMELPVPTYLVSMAVGDYRCYADTFQGMNGIIPIQIYTAPSLYANIPASFEHLKDVLRKYEEFFGPYVWPRVGYVCVNALGGAMEHATNIALPNAAVNGTLMYEGTIMHELFHHWFGDLITCERAEEMWINEGFADYSESLVKGWLYNTEEYNAYLDNIVEEHNNTLQNIINRDGGLYALDAVPQDYTYGVHSYQKGGLTIHSLRAYMGDSLFFNGLRQLLADYSFQNINSHEFFTSLSQISGMNLMHFYEDWIHQPGFADFDIDKISPDENGHVTVTVRQKGYGTEHLYTDVPLDITFVSNERNLYTLENQVVSGETTELVCTVPFIPAFAILNYRDKISDATIDKTLTTATTGNNTFSDALCEVKIDQVEDTTMIRMEHHYVAPTAPDPLPEGIYRFSQTHYWTVHHCGGNPTGSWKFRMLRSGSGLDKNLFDGGYSIENLKLMWRPDSESEWTAVPYTRTGPNSNALLKTEDLRDGQYCFAVADAEVGMSTLNAVRMALSPNPATNTVMLKTESDKVDKAVLFDSLGRKVKSIKVSDDSQSIDLSNLPSGSYIIVLYKKGQSVARSQIIKS